MNFKNKIKYLLLSLPFIDLITALMVRHSSIFLTPGTVIKGALLCLLSIYIFKSISKYSKIGKISLFLMLLYLIFYFITKIDLLENKYFFAELTYMFKLFYYPIIFLGLLILYDEYKFDSRDMLKILSLSLLIYSILLTIPFIFGNAYNTYFELLQGKIGWFYSGNEISAIIVMLLASSFYFIENKNKYAFLVFMPILFIVFQIGTKVSFVGAIIILFLLLIFGSIKNLKKKNNNFLKYILIIIFTVFYSSFSITDQNHEILLQKNIKPITIDQPIIIDEENKENVEIIQEKIVDFYDKNQFNQILKSLLSNRDIYFANTLSIYNKDLTDNNIWFGIGFSNTEKINNSNIKKLIEIDILDGFFHYGIIGLLIMLSPFLITIYIILKSKKRPTIDSTYYGLIILLVFGISTFAGHVFTAPAVAIYLVLYLLLLLNEFNAFNRNLVLDDKISFLALHLGYGGVERTIVNQANMLCDKYNVEIICLYKVVDKIPYKLDKRVKLIYLSNLKPNKEEFFNYYKQRKFIKTTLEGFKSVYILYQKKSLIKNYIYNSNSKIIISTRLEFTKLLNNFGNENTIKIAEEHVYHNNDKKYIRKLKKYLTNIDYLIPASRYLTKDYKKYFYGLKTEINYIPQTVERIPKYKYIRNKNILFVGRMEPEKGLLDLIDVFKEVNLIDPTINLIIVGDGTQKKIIQDKTNNLKLNKNVKLTGYLNGKELEKKYLKSSLFIMTSYEESFGLVLIEAMSYGIPCIAFDSALGAKEIINNKNGILIKNRNKGKMAEEIIKYFKNGPNIKMVQSARYTSDFYSLSNVKSTWEKFIENTEKTKEQITDEKK